MNTSHNSYDSIEKLIFDEDLRIESLQINPDKDSMYVYLSNDHFLNVRLSRFATLQNRSLESLQKFKIIANGTGIHWQELDEDLSLKGFLKEFLVQKIKGEKELVIG